VAPATWKTHAIVVLVLVLERVFLEADVELMSRNVVVVGALCVLERSGKKRGKKRSARVQASAAQALFLVQRSGTGVEPA
jgi:hypothetical protein